MEDFTRKGSGEGEEDVGCAVLPDKGQVTLGTGQRGIPPHPTCHCHACPHSGKNFTEGWVEFEDKRIAKRTASLLNGQQMGGRHRSAYHYDLWCLKYLPRFKWDHLTEEINYQRAVREQKLVAEISAAKRERDFYLSRVDQAKAEQAMSERRRKKAEEAGGQGGGEVGTAAGGGRGQEGV